MICCDCKKRIWHWQETGPDFRSHTACHQQRMVKFRKWQDEQNAKVDAVIEKVCLELGVPYVPTLRLPPIVI
jgi:hypothetical protein